MEPQVRRGLREVAQLLAACDLDCYSLPLPFHTAPLACVLENNWWNFFHEVSYIHLLKLIWNHAQRAHQIVSPSFFCCSVKSRFQTKLGANQNPNGLMDKLIFVARRGYGISRHALPDLMYAK